MNFKKIKWMFGIVFVFLLILATNLIDQKNFEEVQESIETIYDDRLIAQDIVFELTTLVQKKDMANAKLNNRYFSTENKGINAEITLLLSEYETTKLTEEESTIFEKLKKELHELKKVEPVSQELTSSNQNELEAQYKIIKQDLHRLKDIQLEEGKLALFRCEKAVESSKLFTHLEIAGLIILAIVFQLIIIAGPKTTSQTDENS